ncbi:hypothetical protein ACJMK2_002998 [Sinanodonta woodiana]|uniref:B box-type domain-containing protein n=1 Tax=Sinanodonta woodiana TaxID=1069815 RepID=A0ABD3XZ58_SINWO
MASASEISDHSEKKKIPCQVCGSAVIGSFYCLKCKEYYCEECRKAHTRMKSSNDHQMLDIDNRPACKVCAYDVALNSHLRSRYPVETVFPKNVGGPIAKYICIDCDECYCEMCANRHLKMKSSMSHNLVDLSDTQNQTALATVMMHQGISGEENKRPSSSNPDSARYTMPLGMWVNTPYSGKLPPFIPDQARQQGFRGRPPWNFYK